jgi:cellulose biosynthesis protein BcsQ
MSLGLTQAVPLVSSIPKVFEIKEHIIIDTDTKCETIVVTADMLNYFSDSLKMGPAELEDKIRFCEEEENSANLNKRIDILIKLRNQWLQILRSIHKHPKLKELFNSNVKLDEASGKNITNKVSELLGTYIQKYIFGVSKLYCDIQNYGEIGEFPLLNSLGIINN